MAVVMDDSLRAKLEKVQRREWWPVASLAKVLGRPKRFVYRRIEADKFVLLNDGTFKKVLSQSVIRYYEERFSDN